MLLSARRNIISMQLQKIQKLTLTYNIDYFKMTAFSKINGTTNIHFGKDIPMKIQYGMDNFMDNDDDDDDEEEDKIIFDSF